MDGVVATWFFLVGAPACEKPTVEANYFAIHIAIDPDLSAGAIIPILPLAGMGVAITQMIRFPSDAARETVAANVLAAAVFASAAVAVACAQQQLHLTLKRIKPFRIDRRAIRLLGGAVAAAHHAGVVRTRARVVV